MKYSEMNKREQMVARMAWEECSWICGGWENQMADSAPETEAYKEAEAALENHEGLVEEVYRALMSKASGTDLEHIKFCGKAFILARIDGRLKRFGY